MRAALRIKIPKIALIIKALLIFTLLLFTSHKLLAEEDLFTTREICESQKGVWREFGSECADICSLDKGYKRLCSRLTTYSCDCLKDKCWDDYRCIDNKQYQAEAAIEEEKKIKELKKKDPEILFENVLTYYKAEHNANNQEAPGPDKNRSNNNDSYLDNIFGDKNQNDQGNSATENGNSSAPDQNSQIKSEKKVVKEITDEDRIAGCAGSNGSWRKFDNGCGDTCSSKAGPTLCSSNSIDSCQCEENKCWDDKKLTCIATSDYKI